MGEQLRGWAELGSFHVPYLVTLYLPFHLLSARMPGGEFHTVSDTDTRLV